MFRKDSKGHEQLQHQPHCYLRCKKREVEVDLTGAGVKLVCYNKGFTIVKHREVLCDP